MSAFSFFKKAFAAIASLVLRFPGFAKTFAGLVLAALIYALIGQGCSDQYFGGVPTASCEDMANAGFNMGSCEVVTAEDAGLDEEEMAYGGDEEEGDGYRDGLREGDADGRNQGDGYEDGGGWEEGAGEYDERGRDDYDTNGRDNPPLADGGTGRGGGGTGNGGGTGGDGGGTGGNRQRYLSFNYRVVTGKWDMIIVVDNSSSMAKEHKSFVSQLVNFLKDVRNSRYHIAVITTDISSSPGNPVRNAPYQDGRFIPIGGRRFLTNEHIGSRPNKSVLQDFENALVRQETVNCDSTTQSRPQAAPASEYDSYYREAGNAGTGPTACPSSDERAIYALNLAIQNRDHESFFRPNSPLMIVILSDEDERSSRHDRVDVFEDDYEGFENYDEPEILAENIYNRFGPLKKFVVYPIIIVPGDSQCLAEQSRDRSGGAGTGRGYYGVEYARLTNPDTSRFGNLLPGRSLSICERDYRQQLKRVAMDTGELKVALPCQNPPRLALHINGSKKHIRRSNIQQGTLIIKPGAVPVSATLEVRGLCPEI